MKRGGALPLLIFALLVSLPVLRAPLAGSRAAAFSHQVLLAATSETEVAVPAAMPSVLRAVRSGAWSVFLRGAGVATWLLTAARHDVERRGAGEPLPPLGQRRRALLRVYLN